MQLIPNQSNRRSMVLPPLVFPGFINPWVRDEGITLYNPDTWVLFDIVRKIEGTIFGHFVATVAVVDREQAGVIVVVQDGVVSILKT
jgi:hypothetical protein